MHDALGEEIRKRGNEYGAVTGRPRRCGWIDLPLLRYSNFVDSTEWLVVTKLDVLDELPEIPVCVGYKIDGKTIDEIPPQDCGFKKISRSSPRCRDGANRRSESASTTSCRKKLRSTCASCRGNAGQDRHDFDWAGAQPDHLDRRVHQGELR